MIDFAIGVAIGLVAAFATCGFWALRVNHGGSPPYAILTGVVGGYGCGLFVALLAFCWLLAEAFRPR